MGFCQRTVERSFVATPRTTGLELEPLLRAALTLLTPASVVASLAWSSSFDFAASRA